jgi:hypothetical protein
MDRALEGVYRLFALFMAVASLQQIIESIVAYSSFAGFALYESNTRS